MALCVNIVSRTWWGWNSPSRRWHFPDALIYETNGKFNLSMNTPTV